MGMDYRVISNWENRLCCVCAVSQKLSMIRNIRIAEKAVRRGPWIISRWGAAKIYSIQQEIQVACYR